MSTLHERVRDHPYDPTCFGCKASTLHLEGKDGSPQSAMEDRWSRDLPAFARLVEQGYVPAHIDGSYEMEAKAATRFEIESGQGLSRNPKMLQDAIKIVEDSTGKSVFEAQATPINTAA